MAAKLMEGFTLTASGIKARQRIETTRWRYQFGSRRQEDNERMTRHDQIMLPVQKMIFEGKGKLDLLSFLPSNSFKILPFTFITRSWWHDSLTSVRMSLILFPLLSLLIPLPSASWRLITTPTMMSIVIPDEIHLPGMRMDGMRERVKSNHSNLSLPCLQDTFHWKGKECKFLCKCRKPGAGNETPRKCNLRDGRQFLKNVMHVCLLSSSSCKCFRYVIETDISFRLESSSFFKMQISLHS